MADKQHRAALLSRKLIHLSETFPLKFCITDRQHLIHDENLGFEMRRHRKSKANVHTRGISLYRGVQEFFDTGESHDFVEFSCDFAPCHAEDGAVQKDVLTPSKFP